MSPRLRPKRTVSEVRSRALFYIMAVVWAIFIVRIFYIQIIKHDYYSNLANTSQERKFELDAQRGSIFAYDREEVRPLVLNENLPTIFADPRFITDPDTTADLLNSILGGKKSDYVDILKKDTAYAVVATKVSLATAKKLDEANIKGVGTIDRFYRAYPDSKLAAHVLGFVNSEGVGQYGLEEYLNAELSGTPGRVDAITDVFGVPLRGDDRNIISNPVAGQDITLTVDLNLQQKVEELLKQQVKEGKAAGGGVIVVNPNSGDIKAMASYPTFDPASFSKVKNYNDFINTTITSPYEAGSVVKLFSMSTGLDTGAVTRNSTYFDTGFVKVEDRTISNAAVITSNVTRSMDDVIKQSINTGVVHVLSELGGGKINAKARNTLYDYYTSKFGFGKTQGVDLAGEADGVVFEPDEGFALNVRYANMTFGQGITTTMLQLATAASSLINGGTAYRPNIIAVNGNQAVDPVILRKDVVKKRTSDSIKAMMQLVVNEGAGKAAKIDGYKIGGKTGTAQLPESDGTYSETKQVGSFVGYIEGADGVEYVIVTRIDEPIGYRYAGSGAAAPLFKNIAHWLIDYDRIPPIE